MGWYMSGADYRLSNSLKHTPKCLVHECCFSYANLAIKFLSDATPRSAIAFPSGWYSVEHYGDTPIRFKNSWVTQNEIMRRCP